MTPQPYIVCPKCGMVSHNPNDVRERYCGNCHAFHDQLLTNCLRPPGYWMNETGGELVPAITRYLDGLRLSPRDVTLIRLYLQQWIGSPVWDTNPALDDAGRETLARLRETAGRVTDRKSIHAWIEAAIDFEVDPI